jgi:predicted nucleotidyltransferase
MAPKQSAPAPYRQPYRYASPDVPMTAIRRFARQIGERFQPEKIILFGSYAYGRPHVESDVDLLVIMPAWNEISKAVRISLAFERPFALDLIVRTPRHLERGLKEGDWFLSEIVEKGKVLYEAPHRRLGAKGRGRHGQRPTAGGGQAPLQGPGMFPLPTVRRKVPQGGAARTRRRRSPDA